MAVNAYELRESRANSSQGHWQFRETRFYRVDGFPPETAIINAVQADGSALPAKGDLHPDAAALGWLGVEVRDVQASHYRGQLNTSLVTILFASGPTIGADSGLGVRHAIWKHSSGVQTESITHEPFVQGQPQRKIPGGASVETALLLVTAILDGAHINHAMRSRAGEVNVDTFGPWEPRTAKFTGFDEGELLYGWNANDGGFAGTFGKSVIRLGFSVHNGVPRRTWDEVRPEFDDGGVPTGEVKTYRVPFAFDFDTLFTNTGFLP